MTPTELASLEALAKAATPGDWEVIASTRGDWPSLYVRGATDEGIVAMVMQGVIKDRFRHNASYIAAANPAAILSLIEENKRMREALDHVQGAVTVDTIAYMRRVGDLNGWVNRLTQRIDAALEPQS